MRHALRLLCAAVVLLLPAVAAAQYSYQPSYYRPFPPPLGHQPPATPFFYAPPVAHIGGYGSFGNCGQWCVRPAPTPCCYRGHAYGYGGGFGYGIGGYGYGGYAQGHFHGHYGHQHHYGNHPPHMPPHRPPPRRMSKTPVPAPAPLVQGPTQSQAQAYYSSPAYAQWYAAHGQAYAAHQQQAVTRMSVASRPKPTALRGASKPLPPLKPVADASSATK